MLRRRECSAASSSPDPRWIRLFFDTSAGSGGPNFPVGRVTLEELDDRVVVAVFEDTSPPEGELVSIEHHARVTACVEVQLREELGGRAIHDAGARPSRPLPDPSAELQRVVDCVRWRPRKRRETRP